MKSLVLLSLVFAGLVSHAETVVHTRYVVHARCKVLLLAARPTEKGRIVGSLECKRIDNTINTVGIIAEDADVKSLLLSARSAKILVSAIGVVQEHEETKRVLLNQVELAYAE